MATKFYQGRDGDVKIGSTATASIESWTATITTNMSDPKTYDSDGWATPIPINQSWTGSITGKLYLSDANQLEFLNTAISGSATGVSTFKLYITDSIYLAPDTDTFADATVILGNFAVNHSASDIVSFTMDFSGYGPVAINGVS